MEKIINLGASCIRSFFESVEASEVLFPNPAIPFISIFIPVNSSACSRIIYSYFLLNKIKGMRKFLKIRPSIIKRISIDVIGNITLAARNNLRMHSVKFGFAYPANGIEYFYGWVPVSSPIPHIQPFKIFCINNCYLTLSKSNMTNRFIIWLNNLFSMKNSLFMWNEHEYSLPMYSTYVHRKVE